MLPAVTDIDVIALESGAWHIPLTDVEFTLCHGNDAARFLQGQLSCNVHKLTPTHSLRGALCNLKGRVITDLQVVYDNKGLLLLTRHGMRSKLISTLNKYRVFFKATLEPFDDKLSVFGLGGTDCVAAALSAGISLPTQTDQVTGVEGIRIIALPQSQLSSHPRFLCIADTNHDTVKQTLEVITKRFARLPESLWRLADIRDGQVHIKPEQTEMFTPQLLNYDVNGVIDFKKGCYTGQEIVARMHYKVEAKRRLYHLKSMSLAVHKFNFDDSDVEIVDMAEFQDGTVESLGIVNEKSLPAVASQVSLTSFSTIHFP